MVMSPLNPNSSADINLHTVPSGKLTDLPHEKLFSEIQKDTKHSAMLGTGAVVHSSADVPCPAATAVAVGDQYVHANKVNTPDGHDYILAGLPTARSQELYWKMVLQKSDLIVDLTSQLDNISETTYPAPGETLNFGNLEVSCKSVKAKDDCQFYTMLIKDKATGKEKFVFRIHYPDWPQGSGIEPQKLKNLITLFYRQKNMSELLGRKQIPIIQSHEGIGRAGTFMAACVVNSLAATGQIDSNNLIDQIKKIILLGREQRGPGFVKTPTEYKALLEFANNEIHKHELSSPPLSEILSRASSPTSTSPREYTPMSLDGSEDSPIKRVMETQKSVLEKQPDQN